jgi:hypothetical protein
MHFSLSRINILESLSTAELICNGFIPRRLDRSGVEKLRQTARMA